MVDILEYVSDYFCFLLSFVVVYVFVKKYKEIFFYIFCIVGMRFFFERKQLVILVDLVKDLLLEFDFFFLQFQVEVIFGKQEGVYVWIGINFVLGRFDYEDELDVEVIQELVVGWRRIVGILDMGGVFF